MSCLIYIPVNLLRRTNKRYSILFYSNSISLVVPLPKFQLSDRTLPLSNCSTLSTRVMAPPSPPSPPLSLSDKDLLLSFAQHLLPVLSLVHKKQKQMADLLGERQEGTERASSTRNSILWHWTKILSTLFGWGAPLVHIFFCPAG
jgi:hypothetical protein